MYQYPYTEAPSESSQLPSWLSNYYSNREAGLFGEEANKFYENRPSLAYSGQAAQTPTAYSQVPSGIRNLYLEDGGLEDYGFDEGPAGTTEGPAGTTADYSLSGLATDIEAEVTDYSLSDLATDIETEVTDLATDIESEFSNISNEVESLSNYDLNDLSLSDVQTGLNSTIGTIALNALTFTPFAPVARALSFGLAASNAYDSITSANQSRGMFGLANMSFEDAVATAFGFSGYDFTDAERSDIASTHGTVGDVGAPGGFGYDGGRGMGGVGYGALGDFAATSVADAYGASFDTMGTATGLDFSSEQDDADAAAGGTASGGKGGDFSDWGDFGDYGDYDGGDYGDPGGDF